MPPNLTGELIKHKLLLAGHCARSFRGVNLKKSLFIVSGLEELYTFSFCFVWGGGVVEKLRK